MKNAMVVFLAFVLSGCTGVSPLVTQSQREALKAGKRYRAGYKQLVKKYLEDVERLLQSSAYMAALSAIDKETDKGKIKAQLKRYREALTAIRERLSKIKLDLERNEKNYIVWERLSEGVYQVLKQLEKRQSAADQLSERLVDK